MQVHFDHNTMFSVEQSWFVRKVICWRAAASVAWAVLLLPFVTAVFVVLSRFSLLHPIQWITECLSLLGSASFVFSFLMLCGVLIIVGFFNLEYYTVVPSIACSRMALLGQLLHPRQFVHSLVHSAMGVIIAWCCAVTIGGRYRTLGYPCTLEEGSPQMCLSEPHLFLLLAGAFIGYSHSLLGVVHNINYVSFHSVQQYKYLRFKGTLPSVVRCSVTQAFQSVRNFILLYFFLGYAPRTWICKTLDLQLNSSVHSLDTLAGLLDLSLLFHLWVSGAFLLLSWYITVLLFRIFVTEVYSFPVQSAFAEDEHQCLPKVLTGQQPMILKFLALQDLALLSQHSPSQRLEVFSLSQPGGHPHNWNAISRECLSLLGELTQRLVTHHDSVSSNGRAKSQSTGSENRSTTSESSGAEDLKTPLHGGLAGTPVPVFLRSSTAPFTPDLDGPLCSPALRRLAAPSDTPASPAPWFGAGLVQSPHVVRRGPKLWSASADSQLSASPPASPAAAPGPAQVAHKPSFLAQFLQNRKEQVKHFLGKRVLVMYLFNKLPEASSQALFADSQSHIWALEGLSHLVVASYTEDRFGVVQTSLPSILSSMLLLQEAVDRHFKLPHASSKPSRSTCSMGDHSYKTLRFALRASLKTAIYRITTTFREHLHAVQMSAEHRKRLQHFLEYKE